MTPEEFRGIALELPEATEGAHMSHPDFRVRGKIFATLWPGERRGVVLLTPEQQKLVTEADPKAFEPVPGGWGRKGSTSVHLKHAKVAEVRDALLKAWRNKAPESLVDD